ncbi:MAG: hypothetical protein AAB767_00375, partial [Patescibacteria group bacterium]
MDEVEFSEEKEDDASIRKLSRLAAANKKSFIRSLPVMLGLAKDETGTDLVLIGIGATALVLAAGIFLYARSI